MKKIAFFLTFAIIACFTVTAQDVKAKSAYNYHENADRLFQRAQTAKDYENTIPDMASLERIIRADRNIFLVSGAHFNPPHIRNMEKVFTDEKVYDNAEQWLFLIEGITSSSANYSDYAEIEYAAQSAQAWNIPAENIIPYYNAPQVFIELAQAVGTEKTIFYLVMFGMQTGDIPFIEGKGYDENQIRSTIANYIQFCQSRNIPFEISKLNALFPITNSKYAQTADECWDIHLDIRNKIATENLKKVLQRYPEAVNILVYCGSAHADVFKEFK